MMELLHTSLHVTRRNQPYQCSSATNHLQFISKPWPKRHIEEENHYANALSVWIKIRMCKISCVRYSFVNYCSNGNGVVALLAILRLCP